jgi:thiol:disulfide interchange protein DsbD
MRVIRPIRQLLAALVAVLAMLGGAHAAPVRTGHVTAELVSDLAALVPGTTTTLALRLAIDRGWHTYWRNPGETGLPTTLDWHLPPGYAAGDIAWPAPRALPAGPLMNYGYEGEVFHLVPVTVPASAAPGSRVALAARADWLVCKETCIPEGADLTLELPVAAVAEPSRWHDAIAATRAALPAPLPSGWQAHASASGAVITLTLDAPANAGDPGRLQFFAVDERRIEPSAAQKRVTSANGTYAL